MRGFLILCLIAVASAQGYNYAASSGGGLGGSIGDELSSGGLSSGGSYSEDFSTGGSSGSLSSGGGYSYGGISADGHSAPAQTITELSKEFYTYTAPEEQAHSASNSQSSTTTLKKNLQVIFVKSPENNEAANAALQVAKQISEHQTAIYVLTKENDASDVSQRLQQISEVHSHKPEVRFVKYRTAQDALNAQRTIQAQYDYLGGSSRSSNEGIAPVLNYASSVPASNVQGSASQISGNVAAISESNSSPQGSYLPPVVV